MPPAKGNQPLPPHPIIAVICIRVPRGGLRRMSVQEQTNVVSACDDDDKEGADWLFMKSVPWAKLMNI